MRFSHICAKCSAPANLEVFIVGDDGGEWLCFGCYAELCFGCYAEMVPWGSDLEPADKKTDADSRIQ